MFLTLVMVFGSVQAAAQGLTVIDLAGREVRMDKKPSRIVCLAPGTLRLILYLQAKDLVVGVEAIETRFPTTRPYWLAHDDLGRLPIVGPGGVGTINAMPDLEAVLAARPELVFISYLDGAKADRLSRTLSIPVVVLSYGEFGSFDDRLYESLRVAGKVLGKEDRAEEVVAFIHSCQADLGRRTGGIPEDEKPWAYVGGIGWKGTQGLESTDADYAPFAWVGARNVAAGGGKSGHVFVDREQLLAMDPDVIFLDGGGNSVIVDDIRKNPRYYGRLKAFRSQRVYGLHTFNWYMTNIGTVIADAYAVGTVLHPERFSDLNLQETADRIYTFLLGKPLHFVLAERSGPLGQPLDLGGP
ncbi:MAG: iron ABC transporter substrate-binding protein [Deltaproteobacteria bacterium]|nr:iron ABC transporter substrate-binding protein [Deltaproteobacteria bacterium]